MSEEPSLTESNKEPVKPFPTRNYSVEEPPSKLGLALIGLGLLIGSLLLACVFPPLFLVGLIAAFASLFFEGYRYIFIGYLLSALIGIGLAFLAIIVICGSGHSHI